MLRTLALLALQAVLPTVPTIGSLSNIAVYNGTWTITATHSMAGPGKSDNLVNHCSATEAFYACEQVVNGKAMALIVFTLGDVAGHYHTQVVLPDGHATGRADLTIDGNHWTFLGKSTSDDGKVTTTYRTENFFTGRDRIHFEQFESTDGLNWQKKNDGDEVRSSKP